VPPPVCRGHGRETDPPVLVTRFCDKPCRHDHGRPRFSCLEYSTSAPPALLRNVTLQTRRHDATRVVLEDALCASGRLGGTALDRQCFDAQYLRFEAQVTFGETT